MTNNINEVVKLQAEIDNLGKRLTKALEQVDRWRIGFETRVEQDVAQLNKFQIVITGRVGKKVYSRLLSASDVEYFVADPSTITKMLAETFVREMLLDVSEQDLNDVLSPAMRSVARLNGVMK